MRLYRVWTKYRNLFKEQRVSDFVNDLGFILCIMPFTYYVVTTLER